MALSLNIRELVFRGIEKLLYGDLSEGHYVLEEDWDVLIILDACRYDVFSECVSKSFGSRGKLEYRISHGPPTARFIKENFLAPRFLTHLKDLVYVSANPVVDVTLGEHRKIFYKYIPVWQYAWNEDVESVLPEDVAYFALKAYMRYIIGKDKRLIVHFLQPHYPFIGEKYGYISKFIKREMRHLLKDALPNPSAGSNKTNVRDKLRFQMRFFVKPLIKQCMITDTSLYLGLISNKYSLNDIIKAYIENLLVTLPIVKKLIEILSGRIIITSDHGEAFGTFLHKFIPLRVYGHVNRVRVEELTKVPWYSVENDINCREALRRALRYMLKLRLRKKG